MASAPLPNVFSRGVHAASPRPDAAWTPRLNTLRTGSPIGARSPRRRAYTLLEMLATVAALVILLGLMVDLARYVRNDSSVKLTKHLLYECDVLLNQYLQHHAGQLPMVASFTDGSADLNEADLQRRAIANNRDFVAALRVEAAGDAAAFGGLPESIYNEATLRDAWGMPIIFMPAMNREIGIAPQNRPFFFSAGPDRRYLTQDDNLYSYEERATDSETEKP